MVEFGKDSSCKKIAFDAQRNCLSIMRTNSSNWSKWNEENDFGDEWNESGWIRIKEMRMKNNSDLNENNDSDWDEIPMNQKNLNEWIRMKFNSDMNLARIFRYERIIREMNERTQIWMNELKYEWINSDLNWENLREFRNSEWNYQLERIRTK